MSLGLLFTLGFFCTSWAQSTEDARARNWLAFQRLLFKDSSAAWTLTTTELHQLDSAQKVSPLSACVGITQISCAVNAPLPVKELKLEGKRLNSQKVQLDWETIGEYNSYIFVIERQTSQPNQFDSLGFMPAAGLSYGKLKYHGTDFNSYGGDSYYRIKEVDIDGRYMYSNIVRVSGVPATFEVNVVPNPASTTNLRFYFTTSQVSQKIDFTITNSSGMLFIKKEKFDVSTGYYQVPSAEQLLPGTYFITVHTGDGVYTKQFIVVY